MARMGFNLILGYTTIYGLSDVQERMRELIRRKDMPVNDWLLITAGGPNAQGLTFAGEEFVAGLLFDHELRSLRPRTLGELCCTDGDTGMHANCSPASER